MPLSLTFQSIVALGLEPARVFPTVGQHERPLTLTFDQRQLFLPAKVVDADQEVHANGRLTDANGRPEDASSIADLRAIADAAESSIAALALTFVLHHPYFDLALSGAATTRQLASHVEALGRDLDEETLARVARLAESRDVYGATWARLPWS